MIIEDVVQQLIRLEQTNHSINLLSGNLNDNFVVQIPNQKKYIVRKPNLQGRKKIIPYILAEAQAVGFFDNRTNCLKIRSYKDQFGFVQLLKKHQIPVVNLLHADNHIQIIDYIENAITLASLWKTQNSRALRFTEKVLTQLVNIHKQDIVLGDRWGENELITPTGDILFVDFDIAIWGSAAKEYELARLLFFLSYFAQLNDNQHHEIELLKQFYRHFLKKIISEDIYQKKILMNFIINYYSYYSSHQNKFNWNDQKTMNQFFKKIII